LATRADAGNLRDERVLWAAFEARGNSVVGMVQPGGQFPPAWTVDDPVQSLYSNAADRQLVAAARASGSILLTGEGAAGVHRLLAESRPRRHTCGWRT
jgi:hypothetical protein